MKPLEIKKPKRDSIKVNKNVWFYQTKKGISLVVWVETKEGRVSSQFNISFKKMFQK